MLGSLVHLVKMTVKLGSSFIEPLILGILVLGSNNGWKQECNIGKTNTQNFVQIQHNRLYNMIQYKAEAEGIQVILQEESYTSKASYLDKDAIPTYNPEEENKKYSFSGKRIHR